MLLLLLLASAFLLVPWAGAGEYREMAFRGRHARAEMGTEWEICVVPALSFFISLLSAHMSQLRLRLKPVVHYRYLA